MKVLSAAFVTSARSAAGAPQDADPRIALVGRSNVGKSSLINALVGQQIARASATPGRTRLANFYRVAVAGRELPVVWLLDLPGYGYVKAGGSAARAEFARIAEELLGDTASALLVVDARHAGLDADRAARDWLAARGLRVAIVATKVDKLTRAARSRAIREISETLEGPAIAFSAASGEGRNELWKTIVELARPPAQ